MDDIKIRDLTSERDYQMCLDLQQLTWGSSFVEMVPAAILNISQKIGGVAGGAFLTNGTMAGFVFGLSGLRDGRPVHWSHMLAVRPEYRDHGIGRHLKEYQFARVRDMGVEEMFWTFDPLVARNAHFNLNVLGVTAREYVKDMYGNDPDSSMDTVIGTDRLVVLKELPTRDAQSPSPPPPPSEKRSPVNVDADAGTPLVPDHLPDCASVSIAVPGDIHELKSRNADLAARWRESTRNAFVHYLDRSYSVAGFRHTDNGGEFMLRAPEGTD